MDLDAFLFATAALIRFILCDILLSFIESFIFLSLEIRRDPPVVILFCSILIFTDNLAGLPPAHNLKLSPFFFSRDVRIEIVKIISL